MKEITFSEFKKAVKVIEKYRSQQLLAYTLQKKLPELDKLSRDMFVLKERQRGSSLRAIGEIVGLSKQGVNNILKKYA